MPGRELEPIGRSGPVLSEVAAEMSAIFVRAGLGETAAVPRPSAAVAALRPNRRGGGGVMLLVAAAAGLAGLGAGALVLRAPTSTAPTAALTQPAHTPAIQPSAAIMAQAAVSPPAAEVAPAPEPVPAAKPAPTATAKPVVKPARKVELARAGARRREPEPMAQPASCERNAAGPGCRRAVIQADRHLRAVYERAVRRGVPHGVLVDYRDRWADLRESRSDDPVRLIQSYGALAYDLGREGREDREEEPERRRSGPGWKAVADALLPWR